MKTWNMKPMGISSHARARKVKCDETKPVCNRCLSTGRTCEGYGAQGGGGNTYLDRYGRRSQPTTTSSEVQLSKPLAKSFPSDELRYLELYKQRVSWTSSGWFGYPFWHATVIPALASEPAILHAVVALSAAHECNFIPGQSIDTRERFVLKQYSQAITALQPMLARTSDTQDVAVVLVTCMLFTFLEYLRGRHEIAETHLKNGIKLLGDGSVPRSSVMEQSIVRSFAALVTQRTLFASDFHLSNPDIFPHSLQTLHLPNSIFASPEAAKDALDTILRRITHTEHLLQSSQPHQQPPSCFEKTQSHLLTLLDSWHQTYHRTQAHLNSCPPEKDTPAFGSHPGDSRTPLSYTLLLMSHSAAQIRAHTLLASSPLEYAAHTHLFHRILACARTIHIAYSTAVQIPQNVNFEHSICESGVVASLFYTGIKCRVRCLRRHAHASLKAVPRMEGCWDSAVVANVVERVMGMEDPGVWEGSREEEKDLGTLLELEELEDEEVVVMEEERLFRSVRVEMRGEGGKAEVRCERVGGDGEVEVVVFEVGNK
ncbi:hypothetical protein COCMIDRAFT_6077 [Bipolaris oryzae ATCC 44560]|uniref:Zn(2)-C6 fungal-type domain-containing protein n=1 Tax=Bipolaris oryzae ATCC 44560 TaxID=930090 RepID=W6YZ55_COCMI|nr:uncharacterized protein COCMIDRAFT_6077 [Bipolaris oryzae ATCC 44560]EUC44657.1 hypothetical protein COCMIDRAFT_6077 [Bipolaris oryzae ATCC 44560]